MLSNLSSARGCTRQLIAAIALCCVTVLIATPASDEAAAALPTYCSQQGYFDGLKRAANADAFGARANVDTFDPFICSSISSASAWVMVSALDNGATTGDENYAQVGYRERGSAANNLGYLYFAQYSKQCAPNCTPPQNVDVVSNVAPSGQVDFKAYLEASTGKVVLWRNNTMMDRTNYVVSTRWDAKWKLSFSGETLSLDSHMPGTDGNRVKFENMQRYTSTGSLSTIADSQLSEVDDPMNASCGMGCVYGFQKYLPTGGTTVLKIWTN